MRHHDQRAPAAASRVQAQARPLFYETRVTPVAAVADALETDIHVLTLNDFLAEQPFNWELPAAAAVLKQCPPFQICPESPCSVALETAPDGVPASCGPLQNVGIEPFDVSTCADDALLYSWLFLHETGGDGGRAREYPQQQEQLPPLQATRAPQTYPQPHSLNGDFSSQDVGKERLRKRQRMYEQKYRKKKRVSCLSPVCSFGCVAWVHESQQDLTRDVSGVSMGVCVCSDQLQADAPRMALSRDDAPLAPSPARARNPASHKSHSTTTTTTACALASASCAAAPRGTSNWAR